MERAQQWSEAVGLSCQRGSERRLRGSGETHKLFITYHKPGPAHQQDPGPEARGTGRQVEVVGCREEYLVHRAIMIKHKRT